MADFITGDRRAYRHPAVFSARVRVFGGLAAAHDFTAQASLLMPASEKPGALLASIRTAACFSRGAAQKALTRVTARGLGMIPVIIGNTFRVQELEKRMFERGIVRIAYLPPGVPINTGRLSSCSPPNTLKAISRAPSIAFEGRSAEDGATGCA